MNLRQIEAFRMVMLAGSITAAAHLLRVTQPTISKLIAQLERQTKLRLFDRVRKRLIPRPEAHALLADVEKVAQALENVGRSARHLARGHSGHIRIGAHPSMAIEFLPRAIAGFLAGRPDLRITLNVRESSAVKEWVATQTADLGFVSDDSPDAAGTTAVRFQERPGAVCVLPKGHPLAARKHLEPKHLAGERVVSMGRDPAFRALIDQAFVEASVERRVVVETNHFGTACALVAEGAGVTIVDPYAALAYHRRGAVVLRPFVPEIAFVVNVIRPANQAASRVAGDFLAHVREEKKGLDKALREALRR